MKVNNNSQRINASYTSRINSKQVGLNMMQGMNSSSSSDIYSLANEYSMMKTSGYKMLVNANYGKTTTTSTSTKKTTQEELPTEFSNVKEAANSLASDASTLYTSGSKSLFKADQNGEVDMDKLYKATSNFVSSYNDATTKAEDSKNTALSGVVSTMRSNTKLNESSLKTIGITIKDDQTLAIDEEKFKQADVSKIKSLFNGNKSYGYNIGSNALTLSSTSSIEGVYAKTGVNQYSKGSTYNQYI